jgi:hypothetical protein
MPFLVMYGFTAGSPHAVLDRGPVRRQRSLHAQIQPGCMVLSLTDELAFGRVFGDLELSVISSSLATAAYRERHESTHDQGQTRTFLAPGSDA